MSTSASPIVHPAQALAARPLAVASLSREQAELARQLGCGRQASLPGLAPDALLSLHTAGDATPSWLEPLTLQGPFGGIELVRGARLLRALTGIDLGDHRSGEHWQWLQSAVCARLGGTPLAGADSLARGAIDAAPDSVTLRLTLRSGGHLITTYARAGAASWLRLLGGAGWLRLQYRLDAYADMPLSLPLRLARHRLPAAMLAGLRPGDVLVPDSPAFDCRGHGSVTLGGTRAAVRYEAPATLIILSLETPMDTALDALPQTELPTELPTEPAAQAGEQPGDQFVDQPAGTNFSASADSLAPTVSPAALDTLAVTLDFELGKLALSLGALRSLGVGSTMLLAGASTGALDIRCGGRLLGRGEAVDVDGRLGIRITTWSAA